MSRIVRDNYPVERLPEDLRPLDRHGQPVRVVVELLPSHGQAARRATIADLESIAQRMPQSSEDAADRVSALRDEWDR